MNVAMSGVEPNMLHVLDSEQGRFFQRYLLKKALSVFKWRVPENWNKDYFLYTLYCYGYVAIINTNAYAFHFDQFFTKFQIIIHLSQILNLSYILCRYVSD